MRDLRGERSLLWLGALFIALAALFAARLALGAQVLATQTSPDGKYRVTIEGIHAPQDFQLYSTLIATGTRKKIGVAVAAHHDVFEFVISADSKLVAYRYGSTPNGKSHLYSTPIDKLQGILISPPISDGGRVGQGIALTCGGMFLLVAGQCPGCGSKQWVLLEPPPMVARNMEAER